MTGTRTAPARPARLTRPASGPARAGDIAVRVADAAWRGALPGLARHARVAALAALATGGQRRGEVALVFASDAAVAGLNRRFRGIGAPTNVLAFPAGPMPADAAGAPDLLGDVVLARETVAAEAAARGLALGDHVAHLIVHGVLHLLGHDHVAAAAARRMEAIEVAVLANLGIADPYAGEAPPQPVAARRP